MKIHADSQLTEKETADSYTAVLNDRDVCGTVRLVRGTRVGTTDMVGQWTLDTRDGTVHRVAQVRVLDGATSWEAVYTDVSDADAVWAHLRTEAVANRSVRK